MDDTRARSLYADLGAVPVINALGNRTMLGGSTPSPEVVADMEAAARYYVDMDQLLVGSGRVVADLLECEAALVTPGCAAALVLATAACVAGDDDERMAQLPDTTGLKSRVIIQQPQRYKYERVVRMVGVDLVGAGTDSACTQSDIESVLDDTVAAILYPVITEPDGFLSLEEVVAIGRAAGVPVIADAAFQVQPVERFRQMASAADLVGFGAKYFGAPNSSGLLCGRRDLVEKAQAHSFAAYERRETRGYGRPLKIDRQEVVGVVTALRQWLAPEAAGERDEAASQRGRTLRSLLQSIDGLQYSPADGDRVTHLRVTVDGLSGHELADRLQAGDPSIWVDADDDGVGFGMATVHDGDETAIAEALRALVT